jgi:hypothetical protein
VNVDDDPDIKKIMVDRAKAFTAQYRTTHPVPPTLTAGQVAAIEATYDPTSDLDAADPLDDPATAPAPEYDDGGVLLYGWTTTATASPVAISSLQQYAQAFGVPSSTLGLGPDPDPQTHTLLTVAHRLDDEVYQARYEHPKFLLPPEHAKLASVVGCEILPGNAAPGWLVAQDTHGGLWAALISPHVDKVHRTPTVKVARCVGGPLDGQLRHLITPGDLMVPMLEPLNTQPLSALPVSTASFRTGRYQRMQFSDGKAITSADLYEVYLWAGAS